MPYRSLASISKLGAIDLLFFLTIALITYVAYALPPFCLVLKNYYRRFFIPAFIVAHSCFSVVVWMAVNYGFYVLHGTSFFSLPLSDQCIFFICALCVSSAVLVFMTPLFPVVVNNPYQQNIVTVSGPYKKIFERAVLLLQKQQIELFLEAPEKRLIIGQLDVEVDQGKKQRCVLEICFSSKTMLSGKTYAHVICYPAFKKVYVEQGKLASVVHAITKQM